MDLIHVLNNILWVQNIIHFPKGITGVLWGICFCILKDIIRVPKDIFSVPKDIIRVPEDIFTVPKDIIRVTKNIFNAQGPAVQKPVNTNPGLKVNRGLCFSS